MNNEATTNGRAEMTVRQTAEEVYQCLMLDVWPGPTAVTDFGLKTDAHYGALQYAIRENGVGPRELDDALGSGYRLTALIKKDNPYHGVRFSTPWDSIMVRRDELPPKTAAEKFPPGRVFASPPALEALRESDIADALKRHLSGDWGDVTADDKAGNDRAVADGGPILSTYRSRDGKPFWVMTESDRSVTVVLLPGEL